MREKKEEENCLKVERAKETIQSTLDRWEENA
jgi:hypothetical protein